MSRSSPRRIPNDWHDGVIPDNVELGDDTYIETSFSFSLCRSRRPLAIAMGRACSAYLGSMFDLGESGEMRIGDYVLLNGVRAVCDRSIEIGDHCLLSWNVVLMDTYRVPADAVQRAALLSRFAGRAQAIAYNREAEPIRIGANVWLGFDVCVLPGATIGEGAIIGARSVVAGEIPAYSIAVGNPARVIRTIDRESSASIRDAARAQERGAAS
jgi:acetyltransferase-like isoleucine patch superfamily enzyme